MKRKWERYLKENHKGYCDCQLVTAINACYHLKGCVIRQDSDYYKHLAEMCCCRSGACIDITKAWKELGIWEDQRFNWWDGVHHLQEHGGFFEVSAWHIRYGFHSIAIVDYIPEADVAQVTNFKWETSIDGWIFLENLRPHVVDNPDRDEPRYVMRTFRVI